MIEKKFNLCGIDITPALPLSEICSMGVGGNSLYLSRVKTLDQLMKAVEICESSDLEYKVIGGGTNIIASDSGFSGVIIKNETSQITIDSARGRVIADSGVFLSNLIVQCASQGLGGLDPLYGIPGTVGGALINNAGSHGVAISDFARSFTLMDKEGPKTYKVEYLEPSYRKTKLKFVKKKPREVVLSVIFQFNSRKQEEVMSDLKKYKTIRQERQPLGIKTSGSIFSNPSGTDKATDDKSKNLSAGFLLESSGAKRLSVGGARVSKKHANWIENFNHATASDVRKLIDLMRESVNEKYNIILKEEVEYIGDWDLSSDE
ncbi:MAG: UDP-N-acetylenolpyruvoylglucosamine reductase [candidate division WS2 bacterium ADurb.Bin280]|uniref:UDP-N-acetylenolpyruvoylglucosamine reductase n=1 Tax=candidate division WS2 bacterium ADurb.Bin280 TaxID=1852829 RepID=A0A1V5SG04_9BACT|nr:MAG: UDP-N-acetylenolpyruvoylglucosamine reductase [candidate division WS2 bacterium ADurb.Bin280]